MVVWFSSGMSLMRWIRPVMWVCAAGGEPDRIMSLVLAPWAIVQGG